MSNNVSHPSHYNAHPAGIECIDVIRHYTCDIANAQKYLWRAGLKPEQGISDEDCLREGVERWLDGYIVSGLMERSGRNNRVFDTPRAAFAALIDRINGRGTWQRNPWVVAYTMDLQRAEGFKEQEINK